MLPDQGVKVHKHNRLLKQQKGLALEAVLT
jgi:hypothetical protein